MTTAVPESNVQTEVANEWFISDDVLVSYMDTKNTYNLSATEKQLKWFNFDIPVPQETPQEAKEREQATMQQVQLGILRVVNQPSQRSQPTQQFISQPPQPALAPEIAQSMGCIISPAFISKLNDKDVNFDTTASIENISPESELLTNKKDDIVEDFINKSTKSEKYKFSLNGKQKIGRNDLCPCGSGHKFKKCHGR